MNKPILSLKQGIAGKEATDREELRKLREKYPIPDGQLQETQEFLQISSKYQSDSSPSSLMLREKFQNPNRYVVYKKIKTSYKTYLAYDIVGQTQVLLRILDHSNSNPLTDFGIEARMAAVDISMPGDQNTENSTRFAKFMGFMITNFYCGLKFHEGEGQDTALNTERLQAPAQGETKHSILVLEYCSGITLGDILLSEDSVRLVAEEKKNIMKGVIRIMASLEESFGFLYLSPNPHSIRIKEKDGGISLVLDEYGKLPKKQFDPEFEFLSSETDHGFLGWRSPEMIKHQYESKDFESKNDYKEAETKKVRCIAFSIAAFCFHLVGEAPHIPVIDADSADDISWIYTHEKEIYEEAKTKFKINCNSLGWGGFGETILNWLKFDPSQRKMPGDGVPELYSAVVTLLNGDDDDDPLFQLQLQESKRKFAEEEERRRIRQEIEKRDEKLLRMQLEEEQRMQEQKDLELIAELEKEERRQAKKKNDQGLPKEPQSQKKGYVDFFPSPCTMQASPQEIFEKFLKRHPDILSPPHEFEKLHGLNANNHSSVVQLRIAKKSAPYEGELNQFMFANQQQPLQPSAPLHPSLFKNNNQPSSSNNIPHYDGF